MKNFLDYASAKYYAGEPVISDAEFDKLAREYSYEYVGASIAGGIPHTYLMYSLKKCFVGEKLIDLGHTDVVETPKFDGAAVSLLYVAGKLSLALTRGDGKKGLDITEKMKLLVPNEIRLTTSSDPNGPTLQITGEVMAEKNIANARNYAAGALNLKNLEEFASRKLTFVAYGVQPFLTDNFKQDMLIIEEMGFESVLDAGELAERFPTDGKVFRINSNKEFVNVGYTSNHPRGAFALKEVAEGVTTTLLEVDWQVGRTGVVSPVAILSPVKVGDATVSRATLHNMKYIEELGLEIGCSVEIIRSGEIIPRVVRRV